MNVNQTTCAATDHDFAWKSIDWKKCEAQVKKLQERIVKARKEGRHGKVQSLQWTLTHSFAAKSIAVKRVTTNEGKKTPGVDGVLWSTDKAKYEAVLDLKRNGYKPQPLRRVFIKKANGKLRPLGIPNMTLDGIQPILAQKYRRYSKGGKLYSPMVNLVRYADDFIITSAEKEVLEREIKPMLVEFLAERGLELSEEKTVITHIDDGFDFLGFNIRKFKGVLLTQPSKKCVKKFLDGIRYTIDSNKSCRQETLIRLLNPKITGWANYYRCGASSKTFQRVDDQIFRKLWQWAKRRHPKKGKRWIANKYFHFYKTRRWRFLVESEKNGRKDIFPLKLAFETKILRHKKIKSEANPFDAEWKEYFEERMTYKMLLSLKGRKSLLYMWNKQERKCPLCGQPITAETQWNVREQKENGQIVRYLVHDKCYKQNR